MRKKTDLLCCNVHVLRRYITSVNYSICNPLKFTLIKRFKTELKLLNVNMTISILHKKISNRSSCSFVAESFGVFIYLFLTIFIAFTLPFIRRTIYLSKVKFQSF